MTLNNYICVEFSRFGHQPVFALMETEWNSSWRMNTMVIRLVFGLQLCDDRVANEKELVLFNFIRCVAQ